MIASARSTISVIGSGAARWRTTRLDEKAARNSIGAQRQPIRKTRTKLAATGGFQGVMSKAAVGEEMFKSADHLSQETSVIVTGTVLFTANARSGFVSRDVEEYDSFGRRRVMPQRAYMERKGFILRPKFVFIDGRTGATLYQESYREEVLYAAQQNTPALSSYFELMDRLVPNFLSTLSSQKVRGTRVLLQ